MMNRFFGGTLCARVWSSTCFPDCGAPPISPSWPTGAPGDIDGYLAAGAATQRFWLSCTALGLQLQPQYTPLVFADYARRRIAFTETLAAQQRAEEVAAMLEGRLGATDPRRAVFLGRVGSGRLAKSRSLRLPLDRLVWPEPHPV